MTTNDPIAGAVLLDCTLRDGGYYTAWDFSPQTVENYLEAMSKLPIDTVEIGYCSPPKAGYFGSYFYLTPETTAWARSILSPEQKLSVMLDEKSVTASEVARLMGPHSDNVDMVRIAVAPQRLSQCADLVAELHDLGYSVGVNVMYLSQYWSSVSDLPGLARILDLAAVVSLVDSYGACSPAQVAVAVTDMKRMMPDVPIGFHGHDNLGLALANSLRAVEAGATIIDGTIAGMGRGPGNAATELLLIQKVLPTPALLDYVALNSVLTDFQQLRDEHRWGTNLAYIISGAAGLPQNDVMEWMGKNRYTASAIIQALHGTAVGELDQLDYVELRASAEPREAIIVGGGITVERHIEAIANYATTKNAILIHANYRHLGLVSRFENEQYVCTAGDVAGRLPIDHELDHIEGFVVPNPPRFSGATPKDTDTAIYQVSPFMNGDGDEKLGPVSDIGPLALALGASLALKATAVTLVGFDGYESATAAQQELATEIQSMVNEFRRVHPEIALTSATNTLYDVPIESVYGKLSNLRT